MPRQSHSGIISWGREQGKVFFPLLLPLFSIVCFQFSFANNLKITQFQLLDKSHISFDLTWENAWNLNNGKRDGVWLFGKIRSVGAEWEPLYFDATQEIPANGQINLKAATDGLGAMFSVPIGHTGTISQNGINLKLRNDLKDRKYEIQIFGIEMAWVNTEAFYLGDGESNHAFERNQLPFLIQDEGEINSDSIGGGAFPPAGPIPATWPKGQQGFHCMKYEISQEQYLDFLNSLSYAQQTRHTAIAPNQPPGSFALASSPNYRNGIRIYQSGLPGFQAAVYGLDLENDGSFNGPDEGHNRACNFLNWDDLCAYLDWAGLSPMTEFEFEKACRGPLPAQALEFAWGSNAVLDANTLIADGEAGESVTESPGPGIGLASHGYDGPQGPLRCGFAAGAVTDRLQAGSSYYGLMEMSGNLWEQCVTVNAAGLAFQGGNGDGLLSDEGAPDQAGWPPAQGAGFRGGGWNSGILPGFRDLAVSDRFYAGLAPALRRNTTGGRGLRR